MKFFLDYVRILQNSFRAILAKFRVLEFCHLDGILCHGIPQNGIPPELYNRGISGENSGGIPLNPTQNPGTLY